MLLLNKKSKRRGKEKSVGQQTGLRCQWGQNIETASGLKVCSEKWSWVSAGLHGLQGEELLRSQEALTVVGVLWASSSEQPLLCLLWGASPGTSSERPCEVVPKKAAVALEPLQSVKGFHFCPCDVVWLSLAQPLLLVSECKEVDPSSIFIHASLEPDMEPNPLKAQVAENNFCDSPNSIGLTGGHFAALFFLVKNAQHMS